jgi:Mg2+ and Co2+ transporter CorA
MSGVEIDTGKIRNRIRNSHDARMREIAYSNDNEIANTHRSNNTMTITIIGIILIILGVAASLYQINRDPETAAQTFAGEYWWMAWPM